MERYSVDLHGHAGNEAPVLAFSRNLERLLPQNGQLNVGFGKAAQDQASLGQNKRRSAFRLSKLETHGTTQSKERTNPFLFIFP
jgi:hypothetical protein